MSGPSLDIRFIVEGDPVSKGNHSAFPIARGKCPSCKPGQRCRTRNCFGGVLVGTTITDKAGPELEAWEALTKVRAMSARNVAGHRLVARPGAVQISMVYVLERPEGHWLPGGRLSAAGLRCPHPTVKPDFDKLTRATSDGMTGILAEDDSQFVVGMIAKVYAPYRGRIGAVVHARQIHTMDAWVDRELQYAGFPSASASSQGALL